MKKLTGLIIENAFYQLNLIKGYKYIDKAGEIVNHYYKNNKPPMFKMELGGLEIFNTDDHFEIIKYSSDQFWAKLKNISTISQVTQKLSNPLKILQEIQEVQNFNRIGCRIMFIKELDQRKFDEVKKRINLVEISETISIKISCSKNELGAIVDIELLENVNDPLKKAVRFNCDVFTIEKSMSFSEITSKNNKILKYFNEDMLKLFNNVLGE